MELSTDNINQIIKDNLKSENFHFISCKNISSDDVSTGFLSAQNKKRILYLARGKIEELCVFIKQLPQSEYHRHNVVELGSFERESLIYGDIFDNFQTFSLPIPKCYLARPDGIVVLEDLSHKGFRNRNIHEPLDLLHCEKVLESLAKFHAASFIIEKKKDSKLNELYPIIETEVLLNPDYSGKRTLMAGVKAAKKITEKYLSGYSNDVTKKAFEFVETIFYKVKNWNVYPKTLVHSDLWGNNIMYKYDDTGNVENACILDLQFVTYKPLTYDVQFFLHICTTKSFRDGYYIQLLKFYFDRLSKQLSQSSIDLNELMPWSDFEKMHKDTLPNVLAITPLYLGFVLMPTNILKDVMENDEKFRLYYEEDRDEYVLQAMSENEDFRNRNIQSLTELFDYFAENSWYSGTYSDMQNCLEESGLIFI